jgi:hypothetical protein
MVGNFEAAEDALGKAVYKGYTNWFYLYGRPAKNRFGLPRAQQDGVTAG